MIKKLQNQITRLYNINVIYLQEPVDEWKSIKDENNKNLIANSITCDGKGNIYVVGYADGTLTTQIGNKDIIKGIKAHAEPGGISRWGLDTLKMAKQASRAAGIPTYIHLGTLWPTEGKAEIDIRRDTLFKSADAMMT